MQLLRLPVQFLEWYFITIPLKLLRTFLHVNLALEDMLAIRLHLRLLFAPLFHDTSFTGRMLSVIFRIGRVISGTIALLVADFFLAPVFLLWFAFILAPIFYIQTLVFFPIVLILFGLSIIGKPPQVLSPKLPANLTLQAATKQYRILLALLPKKPHAFFQQFIASEEGQLFLMKMAVRPEQFFSYIKQQKLPLITDLAPLIAESRLLALKTQSSFLRPMQLFASLTQERSPFATILKDAGIDHALSYRVVAWLSTKEAQNRVVHVWDDDYFIHTLGGVNRGWQGAPTPILNLVSTDLTAQAARNAFPEVLGREKTIAEIIQVLARSERENVLLIGESGSGKSSIVNKIAKQIIEGGVPKALFSKRLVRLDAGSLVAGANAQGTLEERLKKIVEEIQHSGNIILFLDDAHEFLTISSARGNLDVFSFFKPYLAETNFQMIVATSTENYQRYLEQKTDVMRLFQKIEVPVATIEEATAIVELEAQTLERKNNVVISLPAVLASVSLADRYIQSKVLPGKAYDLLDEACVKVTAQLGQVTSSNKKPRNIMRPLITAHDIENVVEQKTNIPIHNADANEKQLLLHLEDALHQRIIGQEEAVLAIANALRRSRANVKQGSRPIASFLFVGPTGVGKTELAKALSTLYYRSEEAMVRFDMSEFQEQQSIYSLIGTPVTAEGAAQPGRLTEALREKPSTLVLLDEIEKAHPQILDLFLQILEDGRVTDSAGHTVSFKDAIIIATSNAGTKEIEALMQNGTPFEQIQTGLLELLSKYYRIEMLNRFDEIILFKPLTGEQMIMIAKLMLKDFSQDMAQKGYFVSFAPEMVGSIAQRGYSPMLGARPLRRLIQEEIESRVAKMILSGELIKGRQIILEPV